MWSGGLIKFVVRQSADQPCHQGAVTVVLTEHNRKRILTAGTDGCVTSICASCSEHSCHVERASCDSRRAMQRRAPTVCIDSLSQTAAHVHKAASSSTMSDICCRVADVTIKHRVVATGKQQNKKTKVVAVLGHGTVTVSITGPGYACQCSQPPSRNLWAYHLQVSRLILTCGRYAAPAVLPLSLITSHKLVLLTAT